MIKTCYNCLHMHSNEDEEEYRFHGSDVTAPDYFTLFCTKGHWTYYEGPVSELRDCLRKAENCKDFELVVYENLEAANE